jgi:hypothetical protein
VSHDRRLRRVVVVVSLALMISGCTAHHRVAAVRASVVSTAASSGAPASSVASAAPPSQTAEAQRTSPAPGRATIPTTPVRPTKDRPCGVSSKAHYVHIVWIWMENQGYGSVIGSSSAPFENALAKQCGSATNDNGVSHPSLPNYLAATGGSTFGVTNDANPSAHKISADSIFGQIEQAGLTWRSYDESMPKNCDTSPSGSYAVKHNPAAYYLAVRAACGINDVPLQGSFDRDIVAGSLPSFSFVTPNLCNDTHDCPVRVGDAWLATWIPKLLAGPNYSSGNTLIVITWDEGEGSSNRIPTIVIGPSVPAGTLATQRFDHYALLRTTEDLLGLAHLQAAASAPSMAAAFAL